VNFKTITGELACQWLRSHRYNTRDASRDRDRCNAIARDIENTHSRRAVDEKLEEKTRARAFVYKSAQTYRVIRRRFFL